MSVPDIPVAKRSLIGDWAKDGAAAADTNPARMAAAACTSIRRLHFLIGVPPNLFI
jgi:hypothetical protein